jgi:ectoine hydroxylase-related dioxygenase (phytanoyl-CoA dioxygenase family)
MFKILRGAERTRYDIPTGTISTEDRNREYFAMSTVTAGTPSPHADVTEPTVFLSPEQVSFYHEHGFLALNPITTPEEVAWMRNIYDGLFERRAGREEGNQFDLGGTDEEGKEAALPQILSPSRYAPELKSGLFRVNALAIARQLLGAETMPRGDHAIFKPAGIGAPTPWHQDEAYWDPGKVYRSMSFWIPLQEATEDNGCLWFVPGSHKLDVAEHQSIGSDPRIHGLELKEGSIDISDAVACPLKPGGATIHTNRTLHYAGPNRSGVPRRALILGFGLPDETCETPRRFPWNEIKKTARDERARATQKV